MDHHHRTRTTHDLCDHGSPCRACRRTALWVRIEMHAHRFEILIRLAKVYEYLRDLIIS